MPHPDLTIVATTWAPEGIVGVARLNSWERTVNSWAQQLEYEGDLYLHVADDGSRTVEHRGHQLPVPLMVAQPIWHLAHATEISWSKQHRRGVGASLNVGLFEAFNRSPLAAYFVDDWFLADAIDLTPWVELLMRDESVGMVRLGPPHPGIVGRVAMFDEGWGLRLNPLAGGYVFGHRPALYHQRFFEAFGYFDEGVSAMECERLYNERFCARGGPPDVVYALPYPWRHIGDQEVGDITPS